MMATLIDRKQLKWDMKDLLADAQVSPRAMAALYLGLSLVLSMADTLAGDSGLLATFLSILTSLLGMVLSAGFVLYCMAVRRGERAEFLTLFDGFSFVGKLIGLNLLMYLFIALWSMLLVVPGIIAAYRYRFALYNLYENPGISVFEALNMSKCQTTGYKMQLFMLDLSYFGWTFLASLPAALLEWCVSYQELCSILGAASASALITSLLALPDLTWIFIIDLWSLAVSLFYLPAYQCTELGYFDIAKSTSGVGFGAEPPRQDGWNGRIHPDDLGGW